MTLNTCICWTFGHFCVSSLTSSLVMRPLFIIKKKKKSGRVTRQADKNVLVLSFKLKHQHKQVCSMMIVSWIFLEHDS